MSTAGGLLALLLWSATFALARSLSEQVGPLSAGAAAYFAGAVLAVPSLLFRPRVQAPSTIHWRYLAGCGSLFVLYTALIYWAVGLAVDHQQLLEVAMVNYLWPAATIALSVPVLGSRPGWLLLPGTMFALAGVFLVMTQDQALSWAGFWSRAQTSPWAYICALGAALCWGLYSNLARRWGGAGGGVAYFLPATTLVLILLRSVAGEHSTWTARALMEAVALGAVTGLSYSLWDRAVRRGNFALVTSASYFTPLLSTVVSCLYLRVLPGSRIWVGCLLVIGGTLLSLRSLGRNAALRRAEQDR